MEQWQGRKYADHGKAGERPEGQRCGGGFRVGGLLSDAEVNLFEAVTYAWVRNKRISQRQLSL